MLYEVITVAPGLALTGTIEDVELTDPDVSAERLLFRNNFV